MARVEHRTYVSSTAKINSDLRESSMTDDHGPQAEWVPDWPMMSAKVTRVVNAGEITPQ